MSGMTGPLPPDLASQEQARDVPFHSLRRLPNRGNGNGLSEETTIYTETRMLQDQTRRLRMCPCLSLRANVSGLV
jgi:hypothetical protein